MAVTLNSTGITFSDGTSISSPTTLNGIGSHIWAYYAGNGPSIQNRFNYLAMGSTIAGSSIRYRTAASATNSSTTYLSTVTAADNVSQPFPTTGTAALSGTWRALGGTSSTSADPSGGPFMWVRNVQCSSTTWYAVFWVRIS